MPTTDFNWLADHGPELFSKYAGKWIAVHDGQVVGVGDTALEAAAEAREKVGEAKFILQALDFSGDVIYAPIANRYRTYWAAWTFLIRFGLRSTL